MAADGLGGARRRLAQRATAEVEQEGAVAADRELPLAAEAHPDIGDRGARGDVEVVLEVPLVAVEAGVDPRPQAGVADAAEGRDPDPVGRAGGGQVVGGPGEPADAGQRRLGGAGEPHRDRRRSAAGAVEAEDRPLAGQVEAETGAGGEEADRRIALAAVRLEAERQLPVAGRRGEVRRGRLLAAADEQGERGEDEGGRQPGEREAPGGARRRPRPRNRDCWVQCGDSRS